MIDQATHERRVSASVSALAVASVTHPEENSLSASNVATQANLMYTESEQNLSVSYLYIGSQPVTDDWQAPQSMSGIFANAQNILITGGNFTVSLHCSISDFATYSTIRIFSLLILVECR